MIRYLYRTNCSTVHASSIYMQVVYPYNIHILMQEEAGYVDNLKLTVDLMNKNIFRELIFAESFMSSNLPLIIAQLRLTSLSSDAHHCVMAEKLNQKWVTLCMHVYILCYRLQYMHFYCGSSEPYGMLHIILYRYNELDQEMEEVGHLWRVAKTDFPTFPPSVPIDQVLCIVVIMAG